MKYIFFCFNIFLFKNYILFRSWRGNFWGSWHGHVHILNLLCVFFFVCVKTLIHSYRKGFVHHINIHQKDHSEVRNVSHACSEEVDRHMPWVCHSWYNEKIMDFRIIIIIEWHVATMLCVLSQQHCLTVIFTPISNMRKSRLK